MMLQRGKCFVRNLSCKVGDYWISNCCSAHVVNDHRMIGRIRRKEFCHLFRAESFQKDSALYLGIHVGSQIPGECLCPGHCVESGPGCDLIVGTQQTQDRIFKAYCVSMMI